MDVTIEHNLNLIRKAGNKKHWRIRSAIKTINTEISGLRFTAMKNRGTKLAIRCNRDANALETQLENSKKG